MTRASNKICFTTDFGFVMLPFNHYFVPNVVLCLNALSDLRETFVLNEVFSSLVRLRLGQSESASDRHLNQSRHFSKNNKLNRNNGLLAKSLPQNTVSQQNCNSLLTSCIVFYAILKLLLLIKKEVEPIAIYALKISRKIF